MKRNQPKLHTNITLSIVKRHLSPMARTIKTAAMTSLIHMFRPPSWGLQGDDDLDEDAASDSCAGEFGGLLANFEQLFETWSSRGCYIRYEEDNPRGKCPRIFSVGWEDSIRNNERFGKGDCGRQRRKGEAVTCQ